MTADGHVSTRETFNIAWSMFLVVGDCWPRFSPLLGNSSVDLVVRGRSKPVFVDSLVLLSCVTSEGLVVCSETDVLVLTSSFVTAREDFASGDRVVSSTGMVWFVVGMASLSFLTSSLFVMSSPFVTPLLFVTSLLFVLLVAFVPSCGVVVGTEINSKLV